ncbi:hypothetical protein BDD12DRAFT_801729 [Trichophaea hybrida]|nr:hypothetical protein BDD12DRAFT_801729 [Trichophaea hybrida]
MEPQRACGVLCFSSFRAALFFLIPQMTLVVETLSNSPNNPPSESAEAGVVSLVSERWAAKHARGDLRMTHYSIVSPSPYYRSLSDNDKALLQEEFEDLEDNLPLISHHVSTSLHSVSRRRSAGEINLSSLSTRKIMDQ